MLSAILSATIGILLMEGAFGQRNPFADDAIANRNELSGSVFNYRVTVADLNAVWEKEHCSWAELSC